MEKREKISLAEGEISEINNLIKALEIQVKKFETAYTRRDPQEFNSLKKDIIQMQRKLYDIVE